MDPVEDAIVATVSAEGHATLDLLLTPKQLAELLREMGVTGADLRAIASRVT